MITVTISNEILERILVIDRCATKLSGKSIPAALSIRMRKNSKKKSSYASAKIEGNPLSELQASEAIDAQARHFLKPEQEVRNYYAAMGLLDEALAARRPFSLELLLEVQRLVVKGESSEKVGLRGPMPPGFLFAVYDSITGNADYIPPEACDVVPLLNELITYVNESNDHPLIKAGVVHYQLVTIHPFEDGNGRCARLLSNYVLDLNGYGFFGIGSLEEYFAYDIEEYYDSLQMGLPALYYEGRDNPPHPQIWMGYFLRMVELYATRSLELASATSHEQLETSLSHLKSRERELLDQILENGADEFRPIDLARLLNVSSRSVINWLAGLANAGFVRPNLVKERVRSYSLTELARAQRAAHL